MWCGDVSRTMDCDCRLSPLLSLDCSFSVFRGETLAISGLFPGEAANGHILPPAGRFQFCRPPSGDCAWPGAFPFSPSLKEGAPRSTVHRATRKTLFFHILSAWYSSERLGDCSSLWGRTEGVSNHLAWSRLFSAIGSQGRGDSEFWTGGSLGRWKDGETVCKQKIGLKIAEPLF